MGKKQIRIAFSPFFIWCYEPSKSRLKKNLVFKGMDRI
jgi:hypothetical protein